MMNVYSTTHLTERTLDTFKPTRLYVKELAGIRYFGKTTRKDIYEYSGSGKEWRRLIKKYGKENIKTTWVSDYFYCPYHIQQFALMFSELNHIVESKEWANYKPENGIDGGDVSEFIPYDKIDYSNYKCAGPQKWYQNLTKEQQEKWHSKQAEKRCKGWYVSRIDNPNEIYVKNISKWCKENGIDTATVTKLNSPGSPAFQKQTGGWRIRRSDMPELLPYIDKRLIGHPNIACKGKSWKLIDGKRVWSDKNEGTII